MKLRSAWATERDDALSGNPWERKEREGTVEGYLPSDGTCGRHEGQPGPHWTSAHWSPAVGGWVCGWLVSRTTSGL